MLLRPGARQRSRSQPWLFLLLLVAGGAAMYLLGSQHAAPAVEELGLGAAEVQEALQKQVAQLRAQLDSAKAELATARKAGEQGDGAAAAAASGGGERGPYELEPFNVAKLLNPFSLLEGFAGYHPHKCFPSWNQSLDGAAFIPDMQRQLTAALTAALAALAPAASEADLASKPFMQLAGVTELQDPKFSQLNALLANTMAPFMLTGSGGRQCVCGRHVDGQPRVTDVGEVGTSGCGEGETEPEDSGLSCIGSVAGMLLATNWGVPSLVGELATKGFCTQAPLNTTFGAWWIQERLSNPKYQNFIGNGDIKTAQEDALLEIFDVMYEYHKAFLKQKWMGFTVMQDPFDLLVIQNIIFDLKPDLIIETGTANGGSALLWASILDLLQLDTSRVHTIDTTDPSVGFGSVDKSKDATQHRLWQKYVTFHKGISSDPGVQEQVAAAAAGAGTVLVLLDSEHSRANVATELNLYCKRFVTPGSYCVVEDTKLSRMSRQPGPLEAVWEWLESNQDFSPDRERELMYSQHVMGYLRRAPATA